MDYLPVRRTQTVTVGIFSHKISIVCYGTFSNNAFFGRFAKGMGKAPKGAN